ncbi:UvrD-helicase domain-containing protein [Parvibaculum sp.]|uniref:UvrD-helicase domain-containing protein n=1 Tax=Parvibaculum sp. TaxID=2024848 RepID=UPI0032EBBDC5
MTAATLVVDEKAISILDAALIEDTWFQDFNVPSNFTGLRRVKVGDVVYLLSKSADLDSRLLVIPTSILDAVPDHRSAFERIIRVALRQFDRNISLPTQWQPYHEGSLLSVYAAIFARKNQHRICFEQAPDGSNNIFLFAVTPEPEVLSQIKIDLTCYREALENFPDALTTDDEDSENVGHFGILLSSPLGMQLAGKGTLEEWYEQKLSAEQLKFVNQKCDRPIRLRGSAGTGKTQAMAVKCLRELYADADCGGDKTYAFLTHSAALAHEVVRGMFYALDPSERWVHLRVSSGRPKLWIGTLYELAQEQLHYEKKGLKPLSLDGRDGRELQRILIEESVDAVRNEPRVALGVLKECRDLSDRMSDMASRSYLVEEIMNEFACVLDAEKIRRGTPEAEMYVRSTREPWQMALPTEAHRKVLLEIHSEYRERLRRERLLSMDQMVADFGGYLSTHEWDQLRDSAGFDLIFVDEYHYLTRIEAMTLQSLFASRAQHSGRWPLIMAYDLKQSSNDAALGGGVARFRNPGVGESLSMDFKQVFRSTPQIAAFLRDLDASFPAIDLEGEFQPYVGQSEKDDGDVPTLIQFDTDVKLIDEVLTRALAAARKLPGKGSQVAVLCMSEDLFDRYRSAGRTQGKIVAVTSREDMRELRYARARCVFSMPEYVAGLQFDTVFLIHADAVDVSEEYLSQGARRRYVSRAYLGDSRASKHLTVACSAERGGVSPILEGPTRNGSLRGDVVL